MCSCEWYVIESIAWAAFWYLLGIACAYAYLWSTNQLRGHK